MREESVKQAKGSGLLLWIFVASGFAGLIYQSIWTQYLGLILGHSAYAQMLVLILFMGGMALGAWLVSRYTELFKKPLLIYAAIELLIGISGVAFHSYFQGISNFSYNVFFPVLSSGLPLEMGKWSVAALLIFPQCVLLGATFPLMSAGYIRWRPDASGRVLAGLYFSNSLGAAAGALASTYILLPIVGLPGAVLTAGIINVFVAIVVWPLAKQDQPNVKRSRETLSEKSVAVVPALILWAAAITGATSFMYEIVWIRMLAMVLGSTIHAFELMLAAFISGIAFGGLWLRGRADGLSSPLKTVGWVQIFMGMAALATLFIYNYSFEWVVNLLSALNRSADSGYTLYNFASALISMAVMFPAAFFAGMTLPLFTLILLRQGVGEKAIGRVYAVNTLGSIIGVLVVVWVMLPWVGLRLSLWSAASIDIILGLILLIYAFRAGVLSKKLVFATSMGCVIVVSASVVFSHFDPVLMGAGVFRHGDLPPKDARKTVFYKDGRTASIGFYQAQSSENTFQVIVTNGKPDASIGVGDFVVADEATMMTAAIYPMLFCPEAKNVGIIGFGSGMSTHFVLGNKNIEVVDTIEIEPAMVEAAHFFGEKVERAFNDSRSHIIIDDAKSYFSTNRKKYDIIISEPSNPWVSGTAALFSEEFYKFIPQHLTENGVLVQWVQLYEITPELISSVTKALLPYFVDVRLFYGDQSDLIIIASPRKELQKIDELVIPWGEDEIIRQEMRKRGIYDESDIAMRYLGNKNILQAFSGLYHSTPVNSDFFPVLQLEAPKARYKRVRVDTFDELKLASLPILEVIGGGSSPLNVDTYKTSKGTMPDISSFQYTKRAKGFKDAILDENTSDFSVLSLRDRMYIDAFKRSKICEFNFGITKKDWPGVWTQVAISTISYLSPEESKNIWMRDREEAVVDCFDSDYRNYFEFLNALAMRDYEKVFNIGEKLLERKDSIFNNSIYAYILEGTELAAYALKKYEKVIDLEKQYGELESGHVTRRLLVASAYNSQQQRDI